MREASFSVAEVTEASQDHRDSQAIGGGVGAIASSTRRRSTPDVTTHARPAQVPATVTPARVLVVDDYADAADAMALLLRQLGTEVHAAYEGNAAIKLAERDIGTPLP